MTSCVKCNKKHWICLGCKNRVCNQKYRENFKTYVGMYCDCCDHNFVCRSCYEKNPGYDYWKPKFGTDHSVWDNVSGESGLSRILKAMISGQLSNQSDNINIINAGNY